MIFERATRDTRYRKVFALFPVILDGPDEWTRAKLLGVTRRIVWLQTYWRFETLPRPYRALPGPHTSNKLLLDSVEGRPTAFEEDDSLCRTSFKSAAR